MSLVTSHMKSQLQLMGMQNDAGASPYPIDMSSYVTPAQSSLNGAGIPYQENPARYDPVVIAQYGLAHWNLYLTTKNECDHSTFLAQAGWFVEYEQRINKDAGGWPLSFPHPDFYTDGRWLSARAQGMALSVLVRAYQLTGKSIFLEVAQRAARTFELDILDGGVSTPVGGEGVFFEDVATYPAAHVLSGCIFALLGLHEYVAITRDAAITTLFQRGHTSLHSLLHEFDTGYWTYSDLLRRHLCGGAELTLQVMLLAALSRSSGCHECCSCASRWQNYQSSIGTRLRYYVAGRGAVCGSALQRVLQRILFGRSGVAHARFPQRPLAACVSIAAFPFSGGMRTALSAVAQVTKDVWQIDYLTQHVGPERDGLTVHGFGAACMTPWQFPVVWLYALSGCRKLLSLLRHGAGYQLILPQDGVFTAAFAAVAGKIAGARVVCMDYGNMSLIRSQHYRSECMNALGTRNRLYRLLGPLLYALYWPSLYLLTWVATRFVDQYLVSGVSGDGIEDVYCGQLGVPPCRITRYAYMIDVDRHLQFDAASRAMLRAKHNVAADALVITMICRFAPEKGVDIALESIKLALAKLAPEVRRRVRFILAGDGPLRKRIEEEITAHELGEVCKLWGEASAEDVISLLGTCDVFLHTSTRGAFYSMTILEAMASGCAIVASPQPPLNEYLLAEGRGTVVPVGDAEQTAEALAQLLANPQLRHEMRGRARAYVAERHSPEMLKRVLLRAAYWSELDSLLCVTHEINHQMEEH